MTVIAAVQMTSGPDIDANLAEVEQLISKAAAAGAQLVVLPENFALMGLQDSDKLAVREAEGEGPLQSFLSRQAARHQLWLVGGTIPLKADDEAKVRASCLLFNDRGEQVARYDKLHLFDVQIMDSEESYRESASIESGNRLVVSDAPAGRLGLAVCYDVRFPELFRALLDQGMELLALPAAFTDITGKAHWEPLLRARAIENLCYVIAAAQTGHHPNGRRTHGDSMIIDPWGVILDRLPSGPGVVLARMDRTRLENTRRLFPSIEHRQLRFALNRVSNSPS